MYQTLCGAHRGPDGTSKEKEASKPSKVVTREDKGDKFILYHYNIKGQQESIQKVRKQAFEESENYI